MMPSFKMTIPSGTLLWKTIGELPSKARNAELYRLATAGVFADGRLYQHGISQQSISEISNDLKVVAVESSNEFVKIDLESDLLGMFNEQI